MPPKRRLSAAAPLAALLAALGGGVSGAAAQAPARDGAPAATTPAALPAMLAAPRPDRTTASYGDWVLRCELQPARGERVCEVAQTVLDGRGQVLAQVALRQDGRGGAVTLAVQVGANATVNEPLRLGVENEFGLALAFRRCLPRGCFAEGQPRAAELAALLPRTEPARIEFRDATGRASPFPFRSAA